MKKTILVLASSVFAMLGHAQKLKENEVPQAVKAAFGKTHPNVEEIKWEKEGVNYEAEFEVAETETSVLMDANGNLVETEIEIKISELPATITSYISKNYKGSRIKEAARITDAKGNLSYEAEINGKDLLFDPSGKLIREEKK